jgi:diketogulonate reductase-like aldo/keto reductase
VEDYIELSKTLKIQPVCNQIEVNPLLHRKETIQFFKVKGIVTVCYKPLLAGACLHNPTVGDIASQYNGKLTAGQVCLRLV